MTNETTEYWLRGPIADVPDLLQPVAHALKQAQFEIGSLTEDFSKEELWQTPAGVASPAFHLQHIVGVLDRLFTYADDKMLSPEQLDYLSKEGKQNDEIDVRQLLDHLNSQIEKSIDYLKTVHSETLTETRFVGRGRIPSTQLGLLFHAAEHTMRHTGQLWVTVKMIKSERKA